MFDHIDFPDYVFTEYPKILYAPDGAGIKTTTVESPSEERALGKGWFSTPKDALDAAAAPPAK
jgi:hypothetical protein